MQSRPIAFIFSLMILTACQSSPKTLPLEFDSAKIGTTEHNITYCTINGVPLKMDIYYPSTIEQQWPVVLSVHGGSWMIGSKDTIEFIDIEKMRSTGILLISIDYRLAPPNTNSPQ